MAEGKRYYWLKLHDDFFDSKRIKKMRKMAGGDTYTIIYLKMQLLAMKKDGILKWTGLEDSMADELSLDLDESPDDVKVTLAYLLSCGLAETSDDVSFFFPYAVRNTGSEGSSAKRVREYRERQESLQCNADVTHVKQICNGEKEIEKETRVREKSKEYSSVPELNDAILSFIDFRRKMRKPMTDRAINLLISKLNSITSDTNEQIEVINQSILNGWAGVFPLKGGGSNGKDSGDPAKSKWDLPGVIEL